MDLEGIMLNEKSQPQKTNIWFHLYAESKKRMNKTKQKQL